MAFWRRLFCCDTEETLDVGETTRLLPQDTPEREDAQDNEEQLVLHTFGVLSENLGLFKLPKAFSREGVKKIACGREHFLMLTETNHVLTGGSNTFGQCGEPQSDGSVHLSEVRVKRAKVNTQFIDVAAGLYHSVLLGTLQFGVNKCYTFGHELGAGFKDRKHRHTPTELLLDPEESPLAVFANFFHSALISNKDRVYTWGEQTASFKQRTLKALDFSFDDDRPVKLDFGQKHSLLLTQKGAVYAWGDNTYGELGVAASFVSVPVRVEDISFAAIDIAAGGRHSLVIDEQGTLYSFGDNSEGQCGSIEARVDRPQVVTIKRLAGEGFVKSRLVFASDSQSALISSTGELFAWGDNSAEKLGITGTQTQQTPAFVEQMMGRSVCGVGLGGFFSVVVTGPSVSSMIAKAFT
jgi:alpha-tubulin suppressor-like RCC1 family protein